MSSIINKNKKGFTLIELLIVIAVLATLAAAVVLVINPLEMLARGRDSQRISDLNAIRSALNLYMTQVPSLPSNPLGACPPVGRATFDPGTGLGPFGTTTTPQVITSNAVHLGAGATGAGWVDVNLTLNPGGSPLSVLPIDPVNDATYFYAYACATTPNHVFELNGRLESSTYRGRMALDGGHRNCQCAGDPCTSANVANMTTDESKAVNCFYEIGTDPGLNL